MNERLRRLASRAAYPAFYLFAFALFAYWTFPYERVRDRALLEFERQQATTPSPPRLEIDRVGPYWFTGLMAKGVHLYSPRPAKPDGKAQAPVDLAFDEVHARLSVLPLLLGRVTATFGAQAFGGSIDGAVRLSGDRRYELDVDDVELGKLEPIAAMLDGAPAEGKTRLRLDLTLPEGKAAKATGTFEMTLTNVALFDGKAVIGGDQGIAPPRLEIGELTMTGEAAEGVLKVTKLSSTGDLELTGDGKITLRDSLPDSLVDLSIRFKFSDAFRTRSEKAKILFGTPAGEVGIVERTDKFRGAKRADGFYAFRVAGVLRDVGVMPAAGGSKAPAVRGFRE